MGRLPDLQRRLQITVRKMPEAIGVWSDEGATARSHATSGLACLRSAEPFMSSRTHRRSLKTHIRAVEQAAGAQVAWNVEACWGCHRALEAALVHIEQSRKDFAWM